MEQIDITAQSVLTELVRLRDTIDEDIRDSDAIGEDDWIMVDLEREAAVVTETIRLYRKLVGDK